LSAAEKLVELRDQRAGLAATRTKEDLRGLAETWLVAVLNRVNGSSGFVMNLAAGPEEVQAVLAEFLLPTVSEGILGAVEERSDLTNREKATQLKRLDAAIANAEQQAREEAKAAALAEVEAGFAETAEQFGGVAA
jgi:hypothetical protein